MEEIRKASMEEMRRAAIAYYKNSSPEVRQLAQNFFTAMDGDGDGGVSLPEFTEFLRLTGNGWALALHCHSFADFDLDDDHTLDFWEVLTFYYMLKTRNLVCDACGVSPKGLYFTCVVCFDHASAPSYDLCLTCYSHRNFMHGHSYFLDNYALLRAKRALTQSSHQPSDDTAAPSTKTSPQPSDDPALAAPSPKINWWAAYKAMEVAFTVGSIAGSSDCTIM